MKRIKYLLFLMLNSVLLLSCSDDKVLNSKEEDVSQLGYARPGGVFVLNGGARMVENGSLTYIAPDGSVETNVYKQVNGTELGNDAIDMYLHGNKLYILCNDFIQLDGQPGDGALIIVDAITLKKEKAYRLSELVYDLPEGMRPEHEGGIMSLSNIAVLDEHNIFINDAQALFRFDSTTGKLTLVKGSYHIANAGGTIEGKVSGKSMAVVDDKLYMGVGGFWSDAGVYEFVKNKDEVNRTLSFESSNLIAGLIAGDNGEVWVGTYSRQNKNNNQVYKVSSATMTLLDSKNITADFSPGYNNTSGLSLAGDWFYHAGQKPRIHRFSFANGSKEILVDALADEPNANYLTTNLVVNSINNYVYVATAQEYMENIITNNNLLIYDCSGSEAKLIDNIAGKTSYVTNILPVD
ncbi:MULTISPECIES: DUF5074 domain-containing protein [unclassified Carboxylicivirga]|uniref:DUF5074 domain-containing protein n=1 Tax=Carboxylicivirga TaxID=1628153 RepID=UPI003D330E75